MEQKMTYTRCGDYFIPDIQLSYTEPIFMQIGDINQTEYNENKLILSFPE